jgi:xanthine dehydrogenase accessory factor
MFAIALSVAACLRAGTRADVAWLVDRPDGQRFDPAEAMAITPGGGRIGQVLSGALDGQLIELAGVGGALGRLRRLDIGPADAAVSGVAPASGIACILVPASELPSGLWGNLLNREPVCLTSELEGDTIVATSLYTPTSIADADDQAQQLFAKGKSAVEVTEDAVITVLWPVSTLLIVGGGEIAESLEQISRLLGWNAVVTQNAGDATGLIAGFAALDSVVVLGHDLELTGRALSAALAGDAGYIGAVGPRHLQESRADWLAYNGTTDLSRLRGPAGIDIGARSPQEIALSIAAEIVAAQTEPDSPRSDR